MDIRKKLLACSSDHSVKVWVNWRFIRPTLKLRSDMTKDKHLKILSKILCLDTLIMCQVKTDIVCSCNWLKSYLEEVTRAIKNMLFRLSKVLRNSVRVGLVAIKLWEQFILALRSGKESTHFTESTNLSNLIKLSFRRIDIFSVKEKVWYSILLETGNTISTMDLKGGLTYS